MGSSSGPPLVCVSLRARAEGPRVHVAPCAARGTLRRSWDPAALCGGSTLSAATSPRSSFRSSPRDSIQCFPGSNQCQVVVRLSISLTAMPFLLPPLGRVDAPRRWGHCHPRTHNRSAGPGRPATLAQPRDEGGGLDRGLEGVLVCSRAPSFWRGRRSPPPPHLPSY